MEFFQVDLLGAGGAERVRTPFCSCTAPLARSLAHPPPPLACSPSPCVHPPWSFPLPLHVALPLACSIAWEEGTRGALSLLHPPACRGGWRAGRHGVRKLGGATGAAT